MLLVWQSVLLHIPMRTTTTASSRSSVNSTTTSTTSCKGPARRAVAVLLLWLLVIRLPMNKAWVPPKECSSTGLRSQAAAAAMQPHTAAVAAAAVAASSEDPAAAPFGPPLEAGSADSGLVGASDEGVVPVLCRIQTKQQRSKAAAAAAGRLLHVTGEDIFDSASGRMATKRHRLQHFSYGPTTCPCCQYAANQCKHSTQQADRP